MTLSLHPRRACWPASRCRPCGASCAQQSPENAPDALKAELDDHSEVKTGLEFGCWQADGTKAITKGKPKKEKAAVAKEADVPDMETAVPPVALPEPGTMTRIHVDHEAPEPPDPRQLTIDTVAPATGLLTGDVADAKRRQEAEFAQYQGRTQEALPLVAPEKPSWPKPGTKTVIHTQTA